jgi:hypothetical protein
MTAKPTPPADYNPGPPPASNLVWGIVSAIVCCLPFGVVSIFQAVKVEKLWAQGDQEAAHAAARDARRWAIVAAVAGVVVWAAAVVAAVLLLGTLTDDAASH